MLKRYMLLSSLLFTAYGYSDEPPVSLVLSGMNVTLDNGLIRAEFKDDASAVAIIKNGVNLVTSLSGAQRDPSNKRSAYLDYHSNGVRDFTPQALKVITNNKDIAHVAWISDQKNSLHLEYHLIMRKGVSGIYSYVIAGNPTQENIKVSELRNVYRFNPHIFNNMYSGERHATPFLYHQLESMPLIQDETWRLPDGSVYTKYDLAGYQRKNLFWGVYGHDFGAWLIHASGEYFSGDDLKQDLLVHQDAIILNYMTGAHLGTPDMQAKPGWTKLYGPWLLYLNEGTPEQMLNNARHQAFTEKVSWPYAWMHEHLYQNKRARVTGQVVGNQPVSVTLSSSLDEPLDQQTLGYTYSADSDPQGRFEINNVPLGHYKLGVYSNGGTQPGILKQQDIIIDNTTQHLNDITIPSPPTLLWAIGQADRQAGEFKFGDRLRGYQWQYNTPSNNTFKIGLSDYRKDWFYAQSKPGKWNILFNLQPKKENYTLTLALAAASNSGMGKQTTTPSLTVAINNNTLKTLTFDNDKALYRGALRSGKYHLERITIPHDLLINGNNTITLQLNGGAIMYDIITLTE